MASEITEEEEEEEEEEDHHNHSRMRYKEEAEKIRKIINYQKALHLSSPSSSALASTSSSFASSTKRSSLLGLMKGGSTSLRRLFDMEHTSLRDYLEDYSLSPVIKPILLWGDDDDINHDDPWAEVKKIDDHRRQDAFITSSCGFNDEHDFMQHKSRTRSRRRPRLMRTKSYKSLPRLISFWSCGRFRFGFKLIRRLRICIRAKML